MNPLLLDLPIPIKTPRLSLRPPQPQDAKQVNQAIIESFDQLTLWMPWADHRPSIQETESTMRTMQGEWILRTDLCLLIFDPSGQQFLGATGFHPINWQLPSFEIGYWVRSSQACKGIITESTLALLLYAFKHLNAVRVVIKCDENNTASRRVAEKLNFNLEGILIKDSLTTDNRLRNTAIYARYDCSNLPDLNVSW